MTKLLKTAKIRKWYVKLKEIEGYELAPNKEKEVLKYINSEIEELTRLLDGIKSYKNLDGEFINPGMQDYGLDNIDRYKDLIRIKKKLEGASQDDEMIPKTFKTDYSQEELKIIRNRLIEKGIIGKISESDFLYLFLQKPIKPGMKKILWRKALALGHEFLKRVVYKDIQFDFSQVNACINYQKGKKLDSNNKATSVYKNKILNPILKS